MCSAGLTLRLIPNRWLPGKPVFHLFGAFHDSMAFSFSVSTNMFIFENSTGVSFVIVDKSG